MSELDPVTFLIATELLSGSSSSLSPRQTSVLPHSANATTLILLSKGSSDSGWTGPFEDLCLRAQRDFGANAVRIAFLESDSSSLAEVVEDLLSHRIHQVRVLPLFLSADPFLDDDVSDVIQELQHKYAALEIELLPALGQDPRFQRLLWQVVRENIFPEWLAKTS